MSKLGSRWMTETQLADLQAASGVAVKKPSKYHAQRVEIDNIKFSSKKEGRRYQELKVLQHAKEVKFFLRQVPFYLPGKTKYLLDFMVFWKKGDVTFEDTKGFRTQVYKIKKRMVEELYPIKIIET
jgi:hypothetical protein